MKNKYINNIKIVYKESLLESGAHSRFRLGATDRVNTTK